MVWRWLFSRFLHRAAEEAVSAAAAKAAGASTSRPSHSAAASDSAGAATADTASWRCDVGIVFATEIEQGGLEDRLTGVKVTRGAGFVVRQGELEGRRLALLVCGVGRQRARRGCEALIDVHKPKWVISAGFAGGLIPELGRGDFLLADGLVESAGRHLSVDVKLDSAEGGGGPKVHVGRLLTADQVVRLPREKEKLGRQFQAAAVDMESWEVAAVCRDRKVRFLAVRIITDALQDELPPEIERLARPNHAARRLGAAVGAIWRRPGSFKDMLKLREDALVASDRLASFLQGVVGQLASEPEAKEPG